MLHRDGDQGAVAARLKPGAQIILAQIVGSDIASQQRALAGMMHHATPRQSANQRHQKQKTAHIGRYWIAGEADHPHLADPAMHHRLAGSHRNFPECDGDPFALQRALDEIVVTDGRASGRNQHVGATIAGAANTLFGRLETVGGNSEIERVRSLAPGQA